MTIRNLEFAFQPRSIVLIGASDKPGSVGGAIAQNLLADFGGTCMFVNPKRDTVFDAPCYKSLDDLPETPELAVIATPPQTIPALVRALGAKGTKAVVVITAGFHENEHPGLKQDLLNAAREHTVRIIGPNCVGLMVPGLGLNASFAHEAPLKGDLALLSQSGAIITSVIDWANPREIGFSSIVSLGDMADVDFGDLLDYFSADLNTRAILLYVESVTHPRKFLSAARAAARTKPIVVIKSGRGQAGARAAASHTGALAGADAVYDAVFRRAGLLRVYDMDELFSAAETLSRLKPFRGRKLSVVTNGGGIGVLAVDQLDDYGGSLADLAPETLAKLDDCLPDTWSGANPIDIIGDAGPERYRDAIEAVLDDPNTDALLVMNCPTALASSRDAAAASAEAIATYRHKHWPPKPAFAAWLGASDEAKDLFHDAQTPAFSSPTEAVRGIMHLIKYSEAQEKLMITPPSLPDSFTPDRDRARAIVAKAVRAGKSWLSPEECANVLAAYSIAVTPARRATSAEEAELMARGMLSEGEALALKIISPDILHKSDVGGVRLNLSTPEAVGDAALAMMTRVRASHPEARIDGVSLHPMIRRAKAHELIIGVTDDPLFGPVILFGAGGVGVHAIDDTTLELPPLDLNMAYDMIGRTRISRLLDGYRGRPAADRNAIALTLVKVAQLVADVPEIREMDLNPLLADDQGVIAVDARISVAASQTVRPSEGHPRFAIRPYPIQWEETLTIKDKDIFIRPVRPEDEPLFQSFFSKISQQDMRLRFFTPAKEFTHQFLARMTQIDYSRAMAFVAIEPETGEVIGAVRIHADPNHTSAEYAVLVRSDLKGYGLGWQLMKRIITFGKLDGLETIHGQVLRENRRMLSMCAHLGFKAVTDPDDPDVKVVTLDLSKVVADSLPAAIMEEISRGEHDMDIAEAEGDTI